VLRIKPPAGKRYFSEMAMAIGPRDVGIEFGVQSSRGSLGKPKDSHSGRFYQQRLPIAQIPFASEKGRRFFREALAAGDAESFFFLAEQFRTQDEPTFCGLSTLAMVLNSLRIDPMRTWKGVWRWFNEQNLGCCTGAAQVQEEGLTFDMFKCLANCNGANVSAHRAPSQPDQVEVSEFAKQFRNAVKTTSRSLDRHFIVICYSRESLGQSGAGHFSPIGGYHESSDSVLIMDVARFKYPPHWVPVKDVVEAMLHVDPVAGLPRGFLQMCAHPPKTDPRHTLKPLHVPHVPRAAGRNLSAALMEALEAQQAAPSLLVVESGGVSWAAGAMCRWLQAASVAEPQVLRALFQVGDAIALAEVLDRLGNNPLFQDLLEAYQLVWGLGLLEDFPPLRFVDGKEWLPEVEEVGLNNCGELWVLLLLLLPQHLRAAVAETLAAPSVREQTVMGIRGPWALPLEALCETLDHLLPSPEAHRCTRANE
jgi:glutathione gamma-glutamylcysteinyltransferase